MRWLEVAAAWAVLASLTACTLFPDLPEAARERWQARRRTARPPWWWKPWLAPWFAVTAWWHRPRPVKGARP